MNLVKEIAEISLTHGSPHSDILDQVSGAISYIQFFEIRAPERRETQHPDTAWWFTLRRSKMEHPSGYDGYGFFGQNAERKGAGGEERF